MDKDKNIHQETVTLDGEGGGGGVEGSPKLIVESNLVTYSTFFHRRKETKKSRSLEKATLWVVLLCVLHYFKLLIKTIYWFTFSNNTKN